METVMNLILMTSFVGAFDVLYFHMFKFRLYGRTESVAEEITHLLRTASIIGIVSLLLFSDGSGFARNAILFLFAFDLVNNLADAYLERTSRDTLGGVPSSEQLIHMFGMFMMGVIGATFWYTSSNTGFTPVAPGGLLYIQAVLSLGAGIAMGIIEGSLFVCALTRRSPAVAVQV